MEPSPRRAVTIMRADREVPGGDELATESSMRRPELAAPVILEAPIRKESKKENASGRTLCDGSGRIFFRRIERDKESVGIIGSTSKSSHSYPFFPSLEEIFLCLPGRSRVQSPDSSRRG